jgi:hypothetical protein
MHSSPSVSFLATVSERPQAAVGGSTNLIFWRETFQFFVPIFNDDELFLK